MPPLAGSDIPPLITNIYTADPSAHVFNNKLYIYPSHDVETDIQDNDNGTPPFPSPSSSPFSFPHPKAPQLNPTP